uniref:Uncharacterized protein n=1 Tax=Romanomermis culicivorax TaxID=13658 RepID=A0A915IMD9_ROMCU
MEVLYLKLLIFVILINLSSICAKKKKKNSDTAKDGSSGSTVDKTLAGKFDNHLKKGLLAKSIFCNLLNTRYSISGTYNHLGSKFNTRQYTGQLISVHDTRTLNCNFDNPLCCWRNQPPPVDNLDWAVFNTTVDKTRFEKYYGKDVYKPVPPFMGSVGSGQSNDSAVLVSCVIPCQCGAGQLTLSHWLDKVDLNICTSDSNFAKSSDQCAVVTGTGNSTLNIYGRMTPFVVIHVTKMSLLFEM